MNKERYIKSKPSTPPPACGRQAELLRVVPVASIDEPRGAAGSVYAHSTSVSGLPQCAEETVEGSAKVDGVHVCMTRKRSLNVNHLYYYYTER